MVKIQRPIRPLHGGTFILCSEFQLCTSGIPMLTSHFHRLLLLKVNNEEKAKEGEASFLIRNTEMFLTAV